MIPENGIPLLTFGAELISDLFKIAGARCSQLFGVTQHAQDEDAINHIRRDSAFHIYKP